MSGITLLKPSVMSYSLLKDGRTCSGCTLLHVTDALAEGEVCDQAGGPSATLPAWEHTFS